MNDIETGLLTETKKCDTTYVRLIILACIGIVAFSFLIYMVFEFYLK
jgi:hypothetical protein